MNLKKNQILLVGLSCIGFFYPLIAQAKVNLFKSSSVILLDKNNTQKTTSNTNSSQLSEQVKKFRFPPLGSSRRVTTGATRTNTNIFKILVPSITDSEDSESNFYIHSTYLEYPRFIIYFNNPQTVPKNTIVKFTLENSDNTPINETYFEIKNTGVYLFDLPKNQPGLQSNINYSWQFSLVYGDQNQYTWLSDSGVIQRQSIPTEVAQKLQENPEIEKLKIYGENQIWYDTISYLTNLYCQDNDTYQESWNNLLNSNNLNLEEVSNRDLVSCYYN